MPIVLNEGWEGTNVWTFTNDVLSTAAVSTANPYSGTSHLRITRAAGYTSAQASWTLNTPQYRSGVVTVTLWGRRIPGGTGASKLRLGIDETVGNYTTDFSAVDVYTSLSGEATMLSTAALIKIYFILTTTGGDVGSWDVDDIVISVAYPDVVSLPSPSEERKTRLLEWPFGLRVYGSGVGKRAYPKLELPKPVRRHGN